MKTMTETLPLPRVEKTIAPKPHPNAHIHWIMLNGIRMYCVQPNCDGTHHFYCACRHEH